MKKRVCSLAGQQRPDTLEIWSNYGRCGLLLRGTALCSVPVCKSPSPLQRDAPSQVVGRETTARVRPGFSAGCGQRAARRSLARVAAKVRSIRRWGGVHRNGVTWEVGAGTSLTCPPSTLLLPSLPGRTQFFKDHAGRSAVSGGRDRPCRDSRDRDTGGRMSQCPGSVEEVSKAGAAGRLMLGRAGKYTR